MCKKVFNHLIPFEDLFDWDITSNKTVTPLKLDSYLSTSISFGQLLSLRCQKKKTKKKTFDAVPMELTFLKTIKIPICVWAQILSFGLYRIFFLYFFVVDRMSCWWNKWKKKHSVNQDILRLLDIPFVIVIPIILEPFWWIMNFETIIFSSGVVVMVVVGWKQGEE